MFMESRRGMWMEEGKREGTNEFPFLSDVAGLVVEGFELNCSLWKSRIEPHFL